MRNNENKSNTNHTELEEVGVPDFQSGTPTGRLTMRSLNPRYQTNKKHKNKTNKSV